MFWSNMVPVSSWSSSLILNMKASWPFKTLVLTDQHSTNIPKHCTLQQHQCKKLKVTIHISFNGFEMLIAQVVKHYICCNLLQWRGKGVQNWHKTLYSKIIFHSMDHKNFAFQLVLKYCILMVYFASSHNVNTKMKQWPNLIQFKRKSKNLHKASHQRLQNNSTFL